MQSPCLNLKLKDSPEGVGSKGLLKRGTYDYTLKQADSWHLAMSIPAWHWNHAFAASASQSSDRAESWQARWRLPAGWPWRARSVMVGEHHVRVGCPTVRVPVHVGVSPALGAVRAIILDSLYRLHWRSLQVRAWLGGGSRQITAVEFLQAAQATLTADLGILQQNCVCLVVVRYPIRLPLSYSRSLDALRDTSKRLSACLDSEV